MLLAAASALMMIVLQMPRDPATRSDPQPPPRGTAVIRGKVTAVDTGQPLRRAQVMLMGGPVPARTGPNPEGVPGASSVLVPRGAPARPLNRTILTDGEGTFEFAGLAAGTYRIRVSGGSYRTHYLAVAFGARGPLDVGKPIELADGQVFLANFALPRGGAISGRVLDEFGEPVSRVNVTPARATSGGSFERAFGPNQTDDLGRFRLYGLQPGEYIVSAETRGQGGPEIEGTPEGFAVTYYPAVLHEAEAGRVRVSAGLDAPDIDITLVRTRTFRITGTVVDSQGVAVPRPSIMLMRRSRSTSGFAGGGFMMDQSGKFTIRDVVPGDYQLVVRPTFGDPSETPDQPKTRREYAIVPLTVDANIEDLVVVTRPGATVTGRIVFAEGAPQPLPTGIQVSTEPSDPTAMAFSSSSRTVDSNLQFTLTDLFGAFYVRAFAIPRGYVMKAVMLGATDITDTPTEFKPEHSRHLQIVLTGRTSTLEGTVTDDRGDPASEVSILILPEDKASWRFGSPRMRITTGADGKFRLEGVLAGRYHVMAIPRDRLRPSRDLGPEVFEPFLRDATAVVIAEDETRTVDLRVAKE